MQDSHQIHNCHFLMLSKKKMFRLERTLKEINNFSRKGPVKDNRHRMQGSHQMHNCHFLMLSKMKMFRLDRTFKDINNFSRKGPVKTIFDQIVRLGYLIF
ncbi:unnamed protein product [Caenorhabditis angaria]|uniref:Uncharacterized protein n=1 Tax=Caenorhabditis angaria TaxID=860376 RepID=A0A9P1ICS5_9PELO|nr:unnamed protein product [Caenorhabditis angaria]